MRWTIDGAPDVLETALYFAKQKEKTKMIDPKTEAERAAEEYAHNLTGYDGIAPVEDMSEKDQRAFRSRADNFLAGYHTAYDQGCAAGKSELRDELKAAFEAARSMHGTDFGHEYEHPDFQAWYDQYLKEKA